MNKLILANLVSVAGVLDPVASKAKYENALLADNVAKLAIYEDKLSDAVGKAVEAFDAEFAEYSNLRATWDPRSEVAVRATFETYGNMPKPTLISMSVNHMLSNGVIGFEDLKVANEMVIAYLNDNKGTWFTISHGFNGGAKLV